MGIIRIKQGDAIYCTDVATQMDYSITVIPVQIKKTANNENYQYFSHKQVGKGAEWRKNWRGT